MDKVVVNSYEDFEKLLGRQIGISDYVEVSQDRINLFADATLDHQWIHVFFMESRSFWIGSVMLLAINLENKSATITRRTAVST